MNSIFTMTNAAILATQLYKEEKPEYRNQSLRIYLAGKGCDGFDYGVTFDTKTPEDLTCTIDSNIEILCDPKSLEFLEGSEIDFVDDERGKGFLVKNPNHRKFRGKFYKKANWQEKLKASKLN